MTVVFALIMVLNPLGIDATGWIDDIGEGVAAALAAAACAWTASNTIGGLRLSWLLLSAASASWAVGEGIWCWYELGLNIEVPFPSLADLFFLLAVPLMAGGVLLLAADFGAVSRSVRALLDGAIIAGSLLFVSWATALGTVWNSSGEGPFARVVGLAYPLGDVITATVALTSLTRVRGSGRRQLGLLAGGVLSLAVADSMFAYLTQNGTYGNGNWMDTGWVAGFLLIGLAALSPRRKTNAEPSQKGQSTSQLALPYLPVVFAGITAAVEEATGHSIGGLLFAIGATTTALVMVRQLQALLDNRRLNRRLETTVSELEAREVDLARQAFHDPLTGLVNRVLFADRLEHALERQRRDLGTLAVLLVDLDDFKTVNDTLGHLAGDEVLKQVASRLQSSVRQADTIARIGGDEFALLLENVPTTDHVLGAVDRIRHMLRTPLKVSGNELKASASVGIVLAPGPGPTGEELLRDADIALYEAKYSGKSCYRIFESSMLDEVVSRLQLKSELGSLGNHLGQLTLHYQPILSARTGRMTGVEALMRWQHPTRGLLYPTSFIEYAEETGAIIQIGAAAMDMACAQAAAWRDLGIACPTIAVNLSARQLHDKGVVDMVARSLAKYSVPPDDLTIEITESITMKGADQAVERLQQLKDLGVSIAIDDFGTGWSSLSYLRRLPVDFVKFDRSFTADVASDQDAAMLISLMNNLAHALGLETVAEGIETSAQLQAVRKLGCDHVQGFHLARPAPAGSVTELIREHRTHTRQPQMAAAFAAPAR